MVHNNSSASIATYTQNCSECEAAEPKRTITLFVPLSETIQFLIIFRQQQEQLTNPILYFIIEKENFRA